MKRFTYLAITALLMPTTPALAQSEGFADDFSSNPFLLRIDADQLTADDDGISIGANGTSLDVRATSGPDDRAKIQFNPNDSNGLNELTVTATLSSESVPAVDGNSSINLQGYFFNDTAEGGTGDDERTGDSRITLSFVHRPDGEPNDAYACFDRRNADGSKSVQPGADVNNGDPCVNLIVSPALDTEHTMTIGYDPEGGMVYAQFNDERVEYPITTVHLAPQSPSSEFEIRSRAGGTVSVGNFSSAKSNLFTLDDLSGYAEDQKYRNPDPGSIAVENGKLRLAVSGTEEGKRETNRNFKALGYTTYVEAKISLSSESSIEGMGFNNARIQNYVYNEAQDGGFGEGDRTSDVFASLNLFMSESREVMADVTIIRSDNENYSESTNLSNDPENLYPVLKEGLALDTEYTASIQLDKEARKLVFKIDDAMHVFDIQSDIFLPSVTNGAGVEARINGIGTTVLLADDFRTDPNAKTDEELAGAGTGTDTGGDSDNGSSSGGGCTIGSSGSSTAFMLLMAAFTMLLMSRRRFKRISNKL